MKLQFLDLCFPDWFQGTSKYSIAVSFHPEMNKSEVVQAFIDSVNSFMSFPYWAGYKEAVAEWVELSYDALIRELKKFDAETWEDDTEYTPYGYFSLEHSTEDEPLD
jgi:hypothetical protein